MDFPPNTQDVYLVQYTDEEGGQFKGHDSFRSLESAVQRMRMLVESEGKASARVVQELHYYSSPGR